jgi:hemoglobin-like flavoprotein
MRLLIVGDGTSQFTVNFASYLLRYYPNVTIDILNTNSNADKLQVERVNGSIYRKIFCYYKRIPIIDKIPKLRGVLRILVEKQVKQQVLKSKYDVVCVQALFRNQCKIISWLPRESTFIVGAFWGSDFYKRKENKTEKLLSKAIRLCDRISVSTMSMRQDILRTLDLDEKIVRNCLFGLQPLELLYSSSQITKPSAKSFFTPDRETFIITCGYNGHSHQQHLSIIKSLLNTASWVPDNHLLIFPMTYGATSGYKAQIEQELSKSGFKYKILQNFLSDTEVVYLRKASDLFIQVQKTDAFSGSMQEHLFCKNVVVTGGWLPYAALKEKGILFETIDDIDLLGDKLEYVFNHWGEISSQVEQANNPEKFKDSLWSVCIHNWYNMLNEYQTTITSKL